MQKKSMHFTLSHFGSNSSTVMNASGSAAQSYTDSSSLEYEDISSIELARQVYFIINGHVSPAICVIGIMGNLINMVIFGSLLRVSHSSVNSCLLAIASADFFVVGIYFIYSIFCILSPRTPLLSQKDILYDQAGTFTYFLFYVWTIPMNAFMTMSNWSTVAVMIIRFIAVYFPLKASRWCSPSRVRYMLYLIIFLSIACALPECFTIKLELNEDVGFVFRFTELLHNPVFEYIYLLTYVEVMNSILPFFICVILSVLLIRTLKGSSSILVTGRKKSHQQQKRQRDQRKVSLMLVTIVTLFITCTVPSLVWRVLNYWVKKETIPTSSWIILRSISDLFLIINYTANFLLYIVTNEMYRRKFQELILCSRTRRSDRRSVIGSVATSITGTEMSRQSNGCRQTSQTSSLLQGQRIQDVQLSVCSTVDLTEATPFTC